MTARNDFDGSMSTFITTTGTIADTKFSYVSNATVTEFDNTGASDKWTSMMLVLSATCDSDPGDDTTVDIYRFETEIDGTPGHDEVGPDLDEANQATYIGSFKIPDGTTAFYSRATISMVGIKKCKFSIKNGTGVILESAATVKNEGFGFNDA